MTVVPEGTELLKKWKYKVASNVNINSSMRLARDDSLVWKTMVIELYFGFLVTKDRYYIHYL